MTNRMKWALGVTVLALCMVCMVGPGSLAQIWKSKDEKDAAVRKTAAGSTGEGINYRKKVRSRDDSGIFSHPPEWHIANWPGRQEQVTGGHLPEQGIHVWKSDDGTILGEIEFRDGQPFQGTMYRQGASDFWMLRHYENGEIRDSMSFLRSDGKWETFSIQRDKKSIYQRK